MMRRTRCGERCGAGAQEAAKPLEPNGEHRGTADLPRGSEASPSVGCGTFCRALDILGAKSCQRSPKSDAPAASLAPQAGPRLARLGGRRAAKMKVRQTLGSGNVPNTVRAGAWYHYCFRTACSNLLHDLLVVHAASTVVLGGLVVSGVAWLVVHIGLRAPRAAVACGAVPLAVLLAMFAGRVDRSKATADSHHAIHLHACWDIERCANGFSVYVHGHDGQAARLRRGLVRRGGLGNRSVADVDNLRHEWLPPIWQPPTGVQIAASPMAACAVVVPLADMVVRLNNDGVPQIPGWNGGRNHIIVDESDEGIDCLLYTSPSPRDS